MSTQHPAVTALDHASMAAAYDASFRGLFGRESTGVVGSGADDREFWIGVSDHYGEFSDNILRAGWSRYWELKLSGLSSVNPALGDVPAQFLPSNATPPAPVPVPVPVPPVVTQLDRIEVKLDTLLAALRKYL